jgi:tRNA/rRNA methyltransferase
VRPQMGENIGAAARAMLNFGLTDMRLVAPRDGWPNPKAIAMASGAAARVLDQARVYPTLAQAMADVDYAYATTARGRELTKPVLTPATAMEDARARTAEGGKVAVIFGPERAGLENEDVKACPRSPLRRVAVPMARWPRPASRSRSWPTIGRSGWMAQGSSSRLKRRRR